MIALRKMTREEYRRFRQYSVADYAEDLIKGRGLDRQRALAEAEAEFDGMLPDGPDTEGRFLMTVTDAQGQREVGWIWFSYVQGDGGARQVFLSDLLIREEDRRKGCATAALSEMEKTAASDGCTESVLYVWERNEAAYRLYRKYGYRAVRQGEGETFMKKPLGPRGARAGGLRKPKGEEGMETRYYTVERIDGDYAWLRRTDAEEEPLLVARALLPEEIDEGTNLEYEMLQYRIV